MSKKHDVEIQSETRQSYGFFEVIVAQLRHRLFAGGFGPIIERCYVKRREAVVVLLYDAARDEVVLIEQFRIGAIEDDRSPWLFEVVAGLVEVGETYEDVARREALEESNCQVKQLIPISRYYTSPGSSTEFSYAFCGLIDTNGVGGVHGLLEEDEDINVHVVAAEQAFSMVREQQIRNVDAILCLQWLELNRQFIQSML